MKMKVSNWNDLKGLSEEEIEREARNILSKLELKQKVKMMTGDWKLISLKSLILAKRYNFKPIPSGGIKKMGIPGILFSDGPRGVVMDKATCFPVSMARGASFDLNLEERIGNIIGIEAKALGANFFGGVCINLLRHPAWGRAQETYGEDTYLLGMMGSALTRGVQKHIMACAKHYACNSMENARFKVDVKVDERTLREVYLAHFKKCVDERVASIMSAYNKVNGKYCGHNYPLLTEILKEDWKFDGFVISDFMLGIRNAKLAVNAGLDIEMPLTWRMRKRKMLKLLRKGQITEEQVDDSVLRILRQLLRFNKKENASLYSKNKIACEDHVKLALEAARKSMVLLKNEDNLLPLNRNNIKKIAVIGELADKTNLGDHGSSRVYPPYVITPLEGIKKVAGPSMEIMYNSGKDLQAAKDCAKNADVVVFVLGYTYKDEGEYIGTVGGDRDELTLNRYDEELILKVSQINKNCVVVLEGGSAIITEAWKEKVPSILMAWYPGMEGGTAIAEIIFGDFNPCAKLPMVFPKSSDQLPYFDKKTRSIEYGYYHGYKLMDKEGYEPAFPFGHGLSYTTYEYSNFKSNKETYTLDEDMEFSVKIANTGEMAGEEIAQLYIGYDNPSVERPVKELKGFTKVYLKPGEEKDVSLKINPRDLAYYDPDKKEWITEKIGYIAYMGPSSKNEKLLSLNFKIQ